MRLIDFFRRSCWLLLCCFQPCGLAGQFAVELEKMNVVMGGVDNPISIVVNDVPDSCLALQPSFGRIKKDGYGSRWYFWNGSSDTSSLTITLIDTCHQEIIGERIYRVHILPVNFKLGNYYGNNMIPIEIETNKFKAQMGIAAQMDGIFGCGNFDMVSFEAQFFSKQTGEIWSGFNKGSRFKDEMREHQQAAQPGDWVRFYNFNYRQPGTKGPFLSQDELYFEIK